MKETFIRKRLIPDEEVDLSGDEVLYRDGNLFVTRWLPIKARSDIGWGFSYLYIPEHCKASAVFDCLGKFRYWYWDIIRTEYREEQNTYVFTDLLIDVVKEPEGQCRVLDEDELQEAFLRGLIGVEDVRLAQETKEKILRLCGRSDFWRCFPGAPNPDEILPPRGFTKRM